MASPFPGMDPYLESCWPDVHTRFLTYVADDLNEVLPADLEAAINERVVLAPLDAPRRAIQGDVAVREQTAPALPAAASGTSAAAVIAEPTVVVLADAPRREGFIEIIEGESGRLITVIELLSPANKKPGPDQQAYLRKQEELSAAEVSQVEIDLLRGGRSVTLAPPRTLAPEHRKTYQVCLRRWWQPLSTAVFAIGLRERLPTIPIPLREGEAESRVDLQSVLDRCYDKGRFAGRLPYRSPPEPPFEPEEAAWADQLLRAAGGRP